MWTASYICVALVPTWVYPMIGLSVREVLAYIQNWVPKPFPSPGLSSTLVIGRLDPTVTEEDPQLACLPRLGFSGPWYTRN